MIQRVDTCQKKLWDMNNHLHSLFYEKCVSNFYRSILSKEKEIVKGQLLRLKDKVWFLIIENTMMRKYYDIVEKSTFSIVQSFDIVLSKIQFLNPGVQFQNNDIDCCKNVKNIKNFEKRKFLFLI